MREECPELYWVWSGGLECLVWAGRFLLGVGCILHPQTGDGGPERGFGNQAGTEMRPPRRVSPS